MLTANRIILYCRPGFEKECAAEIADKAAQLGVGGYAKLVDYQGYVVFTCCESGHAESIIRDISFRSLIFARQFFVAIDKIDGLGVEDRITPIIDVIGHQRQYGEVRVEVTDTNDGKALAGFSRKFTVPLRKTLREKNRLTRAQDSAKPVLHLFFVSGSACYVGYSHTTNNSPFYMGIPRLKLASDAPSRSTLKLEEAFHLFIPYDEWDERLSSGMQAVDLGAAPGGWTYQLVKRHMMVCAVDNGSMNRALMETGQVKHLQEDGFKFVPRRINVNWLVCDMVEKPVKVTQLMANWLINGWCREAIFNLKLPMKKRYLAVKQNLEFLAETLKKNHIHAIIQAKQLYHDREEITVHVQRIWGAANARQVRAYKKNK